MPSLALSKLRSTGSAVLSSLPQSSSFAGKAHSGSQSRSTSAGSSSNGSSSQDFQKTAAPTVIPENEESLFVMDLFGPPKSNDPTTSASLKPLSLADYHDERESIRSLKKYYEGLQPQACPGLNSDLGLLPGLYSAVKPKGLPPTDTSVEAVRRCNVEMVATSDGTGDEMFPAPFQLQTSELWTSPLLPDTCFGEAYSVGLDTTESCLMSMQSFNVSGAEFDVDGQSFMCGGQPSFDVAGQQYTVSEQAYHESCAPSDLGTECFADNINECTFHGGQASDANYHLFDVGQLAFDAGAETYNVEGFSEQQYPCDFSDQLFNAMDEHVEMPWLFTVPYSEQHHCSVYDDQFAAADVSQAAQWESHPCSTSILSTQPPRAH